MAILSVLDIQNIISNILGCDDLFGTEQESIALQATAVVQNASKPVQIAVNVFTIGGIISILEMPVADRSNAVQKLHERLESLVPFLENALKNEASFHAVVYDHMHSVNTLNYAVGAISSIQAEVDRLATNDPLEKAIISEFFFCPIPEYTTSDLLIALLDEIQRDCHISESDWTNDPFMPFESLVA